MALVNTVMNLGVPLKIAENILNTRTIGSSSERTELRK
jgi:hypothetical protein